MVEEKRIFDKIFRSMHFFFCELQCLFDDLVVFLEWSMFINVSFTLNTLIDEMGRGFRHEKRCKMRLM